MQCDSCIKYDKVVIVYTERFEEAKRHVTPNEVRVANNWPACLGSHDPVLEQTAFDWQITDFLRMKKRDCTCKKKSHKGNGTPSGPFAFTLTKSPSDPLTEDDMIAAVKKIMSQKSCPVTKYAWYLEHKENQTHPHIHGIYETTSMGRIEAKHFKRAWPIWDEKTPMGAGFRGGYHRPVKHGESYEDYISKDGGLSASYP